MWWWYTVIYKCQMSLESLYDKSMQAKSLTTPHPHLYDWVHWSERTCPRHEETVLPVSAKWEGDSLLPWEMSCRSEESGFRTKASQIILHHQGKLRLRKERHTHSEGKQERAQSQMNTLPRNRLKTNCLRLGVPTKILCSQAPTQLSISYTIFCTIQTLMRAKYLYTKMSTATLSMEEEKYSE